MADPRVARFSAPIAAFATMVVIVLATGAVLFARKLGFAGDAVRTFYLGSEATFAQPRTIAGMLEVAVPHLLAIPLVLFVTLHLVAFASIVHPRPFALLSGVTWGAAALGIASGFAIRFAWPALAPLKVAAFVGFECTMLAWLVLLGASVVQPGRSQEDSGPLRASEGASPPAAR